MNLNVTVQDLRLGRYEAQRNILFREFVQRRAIINDPHDEDDTPPEFVRSELLELMVQSSNKKGVVVVQADRGLGKSTAAKFILKNSAGGIMFCNCKAESTDGTYWKGVAWAVGVPVEVYENDSTWKTLLVSAVAAAKRPDNVSRPSWVHRVMDGVLSVCTGTTSGVDDSDPPAIHGLDLSPLTTHKRAIIVFDDFNSVQKEDILFMEHLFPIVEARGVLAFVLVRDECTANRLLELNGWGRISPLEGICEDVSDAKDKEKIPQWKAPEWTKAQLEALVRSRFRDVDMSILRIDDFGNPWDVLEQAHRLY
mmetsp:Transcript_9019/g.24994  ORF Transcript_9019/g.24994 Transcript_9019/m.24994 type:complete len:310 (-) Transcript_9019:397-1326(-)|eukprot:CAMPEP_0168720420 /NCGR_PEP_ID=MMETSP0724-20121128/1552_1 /TAXON_ID=265536 /ORGANISM="Amphiprora sp., Strain CCMP467" /LENGTH=309 /DNA_ID=CAMNT_0008767019 /DNA_START=224 /DNA_END=1153 /DNA_ORIENTATION=-